jgi:4-hydroxybenzoate polyprenyltransferase
MSSINHLLGGALLFLLGYTLSRPFDLKGLLIGLFFGLAFAGGHLNQEVRDYEGDLLNGIRTNAVVFGRRRTFLASQLTFTAAYGLLANLAALRFFQGFYSGVQFCGGSVALACRGVPRSTQAWSRI